MINYDVSDSKFQYYIRNIIYELNNRSLNFYYAQIKYLMI